MILRSINTNTTNIEFIPARTGIIAQHLAESSDSNAESLGKAHADKSIKIFGGRYLVLGENFSFFDLFAFTLEGNNFVFAGLGQNAINQRFVFNSTVLGLNTSYEAPHSERIKGSLGRRDITFFACSPDTAALNQVRETVTGNKRLFEDTSIHNDPRRLLEPQLSELTRRGIPMQAAYIEI